MFTDWYQVVSNRPFYSCVLTCLAFDLEWGWSWLCCDGDQYLVSMITKSFTFEKQQGLYHSKVTHSLTPVQRLGNQARNYKMDCWSASLKFEKQQGLYHSKVTHSLTPVQRLGNQARNYKMDCWSASLKSWPAWLLVLLHVLENQNMSSRSFKETSSNLSSI